VCVCALQVANEKLRRDYSPTPREYHGAVVRPTLAAGSLLIFDWRTWHRGGANVSEHDRPVACVAYQAKGVQVHHYKKGLPSLVRTEAQNGNGGPDQRSSAVSSEAAGGEPRARRLVLLTAGALALALVGGAALVWRRRR